MTPPTALEGSALALEAPTSFDNDDIFGPSRSFPPKSNKPKPSMISAKLRAKEERKKVIQICTEKLEKIKDPDRNLRRSVCINNTYFKLQDEVRREKQMKHMNGSRCESIDDDLRVRNRRVQNAEQKQRMLDKALESIDKELSAIDASMPSLDHEMLPDELGIGNSINPLRNSNEDVLSNYVSAPSCMAISPPLLSDELSLDLAFGDRSASSYSLNSGKSLDYSYCKSDSGNSRCRSRKRSFDDVEDCDVQEVFSHFYMPPTPRLITTIDDDVLLNVVDDDPIDVSTKSVPITTSTPGQISSPNKSICPQEHACKKMKLEDKPDFENGFDKMLELDTDLNQNKSDFHTLNDFSNEPPAKKPKHSSVQSYEDSLGYQPKQHEHEKVTFHELSPALRNEDRFPQRRSSKSEFEIILDALRLDDTKELCEREDLMYFCNKGDKITVMSENSEIRTRYLSGGACLDSCGQAAILGDQQSAGFHGLLAASLET